MEEAEGALIELPSGFAEIERRVQGDTEIRFLRYG
jgi:hypothetical protein